MLWCWLLTERFLLKVQSLRSVFTPYSSCGRLDRIAVRTNLQTNVRILTLDRIDCRLGKRAVNLPLVSRTLIVVVQIVAVQSVLINPQLLERLGCRCIRSIPTYSLIVLLLLLLRPWRSILSVLVPHCLPILAASDLVLRHTRLRLHVLKHFRTKMCTGWAHLRCPLLSVTVWTTFKLRVLQLNRCFTDLILGWERLDLVTCLGGRRSTWLFLLNGRHWRVIVHIGLRARSQAALTIDTLVVPVDGTRAFLRASLARFLILDVVLLVLNFGTERWYFTVFILYLYIIIYLFCSIPWYHLLLLMRSRRSHLIHD